MLPGLAAQPLQVLLAPELRLPPVEGALDVRSLAGLALNTAIDRIVDAFCQPGILDKDTARLAIGEALVTALEGVDTFNPDAVDSNAVQVATLTFAAELVFVQVASDAGRALAAAPTPAAAVQRKVDLRSLIREVTDIVGTPILTAAGNVLTPGAMSSLVSRLVEVVQMVSQAFPKEGPVQAYLSDQIGLASYRFEGRVTERAAPPYEPSSRTRSVLFFAYGALAASGLCNEVFVPENGLISINPPLTRRRLGSLSTRTIHPHFLAALQEVFDGVGLNVRLINPYVVQTKGEMLAGCANREIDTIARHLRGHAIHKQFVGLRHQDANRGHFLLWLEVVVSSLGRDTTRATSRERIDSNRGFHVHSSGVQFCKPFKDGVGFEDLFWGLVFATWVGW